MSNSADTNTATLPRVAYAPSEFAALFGKEQTWAYRLLYSGKIAAIEGFGRAMIPASEIDKITGAAKPYKQSSEESGVTRLSTPKSSPNIPTTDPPSTP